MLRSILLPVLAALSAVVSAQNYSTSGPLSIDISQIDTDLRQSWCRAQTASCPRICGGQAFPNSCDPSTLKYSCTCTDSSRPNISDYASTIPSYICAQWRINCVANHPMELEGQTACLSVKCGSKDPADAVSNATTTSDSPSASASDHSSTHTDTDHSSTHTDTDNAVSTPTAPHSSTPTPVSASAAVAAVRVGKEYGTLIIATVLITLFTFA